jgi:glycolate oxidase iron-sulfur subunit
MEINLYVLKGALEQRERVRRSGNALRLRDRKIANIVQTSPDLVATGNIGCIAQIASGTSIPVLHTIELLDFAHGGPTPDGLASLAG